MTSLAILLVLSSAFTHALWNFIAKRAIGGISFIWLFAVMEVILYLPMVLVFLSLSPEPLHTIDYVMIVGSTLFHIAYFVALTRGYQVADLSIVYPFSRGIGPLLSTIAAVILLGERPSLMAIFGTLLITLGIIGLTGDPRKIRSGNLVNGFVWAGLTGLALAGYTIWDSYAVRTVRISPFIFQWGVTFVRLILLTPIAIRQRKHVQLAWEHDKWKAGGVAILSSLSYVLMLFALSFSEVSYVAPLRSISILIGVVMGSLLLKEGSFRKRFGAAGIMVIGAIALSIG